MLGRRALGAVGPRVAVFIQGVEEIGDQGAMGIMGELHRIRPAAGRARGTEGIPPAVLMVDLQRHPFEARRGPGEDEFDALRRSGKAGRAGDEASGRTAAEAEQRCRIILALHAMQRRGRRLSRPSPRSGRQRSGTGPAYGWPGSEGRRRRRARSCPVPARRSSSEGATIAPGSRPVIRGPRPSPAMRSASRRLASRKRNCSTTPSRRP